MVRFMYFSDPQQYRPSGTSEGSSGGCDVLAGCCLPAGIHSINSVMCLYCACQASLFLVLLGWGVYCVKLGVKLQTRFDEKFVYRVCLITSTSETDLPISFSKRI